MKPDLSNSLDLVDHLKTISSVAQLLITRNRRFLSGTRSKGERKRDIADANGSSDEVPEGRSLAASEYIDGVYPERTKRICVRDRRLTWRLCLDAHCRLKQEKQLDRKCSTTGNHNHNNNVYPSSLQNQLLLLSFLFSSSLSRRRLSSVFSISLCILSADGSTLVCRIDVRVESRLLYQCGRAQV